MIMTSNTTARRPGSRGIRPHQRRIGRHPLHLMEVVIAIGLLAIVITGVFSGLHANHRFRRRLVLRSEALSVLDNVLERTAGLPTVSNSTVRAILAAEVQHSSLAAVARVSTSCSVAADGLHMVIEAGSSKPLAEVRIPTR